MSDVLVIMTCKRDAHSWARVGQREGDAISLGTITEPGGKDDPTICPQCGGRDIGMNLLAEPRKKRQRR